MFRLANIFNCIINSFFQATIFFAIFGLGFAQKILGGGAGLRNDRGKLAFHLDFIMNFSFPILKFEFEM